MPKQIRRSFQECLSKIKISNKHVRFRLRSCRRTKTPSFDVNVKANENDAVTLSDIDQFLYENFRSLYLDESDEGASKKATTTFPLESPKLDPPPENLCRSSRFFVASGSSSSLITDEPCSSSASAATNDSSAAEEIPAGNQNAPDDFIAIFTHSPSPYEDFRQSMQEMVEARVAHNGRVDWEFMEELLFCYLDLNNKKSYRFILHAFVDLIVVLRENSGKIPANIRASKGVGGRRLKEVV